MISAIVLTKDSEKIIKRCLECLSWADEIIVIDDYSKDKTVKIAKKFGARFYKRRLEANFAKQRDFGISKAKSDWILFIDSDEFVTNNLANEIILKTESQRDFNGYYIPRVDFWMGKSLAHGENNTKIIRLGKKGKGRWRLAVHEVWDIKGKIGNIEQKIIHYPHPSVAIFIEKVSNYTKVHAKENRRLGKKPLLIKVIAMPFAKFFVDYIMKLGFLDGVHGFVSACIMSFHSFLGWSQLWLISREKK